VAAALALVAAGLAFFPVGTGFARFELPKELALHLWAFAAAVAVVLRPSAPTDRIDRAGAIYLGALALTLGFVGSFAHALRYGALTASLFAVLWWARGHRAQATGAALTLCLVLSGSALGEAAGLWSISPHGFSPGGFTGQRNHLAHAAALGLAALFGLRPSARARRWIFLAALVLAASIVVTRCRAAYAAAIVAALAAIPPLVRSRAQPPWLEAATRRALLGIACGVLCGPMLGRALHWTSPAPYRDSLARIAEAGRGSGALRKAEALATLALARRHPFGLGPGQWSPAFAAVAPAEVRRTALEDGTLPRLAHGDLLARAAEGGLPGAAAAALLIVAIARALWTRGDLARMAPLGCALVIVELFDAGVSIPSTGIVAALLGGAMLPRAADAEAARWPRVAMLSIAALALVAAPSLGRAIAADRIFATSDSPAALVAACEADATACAHCVDAARRALVIGDCDGAARAINALLRAYPAHPLLSPLGAEHAACRGRNTR
jgi:hypothetical protein